VANINYVYTVEHITSAITFTAAFQIRSY